MDHNARPDDGLFHALVENNMDIITVLDRDFLYSYYSPSAENLLGYDGTELLGKSPTDYIHPDDLPEVSETFARLIREPGAEARAEYRFRHKDGSWRSLESRAKLMPEGSGAFRIIVNSRDVTEQKAIERDLERHRERLEEMVAERTRELEQINERMREEIGRRVRMEEELREREAGYRLLAENVADVIWTTDLDMRFTYISPSVELVTGYSVEEAMRGHFAQALTPDSAEIVAKVIDEARGAFQAGELDLDTTWTLEVEQYRKDGSPIWIDLTVRLIRDEGGKLLGLLGMSRDITERKSMEEELRRGERYFRALTENAHDIISVLDENGTRIYSSPSFALRTGYTQEELLGKSVFDLVHPDDLAVIRDVFTEGLEKPDGTRRFNFRMRYKDGTWHHHEAVGMNLLYDPAVRGIVVNSRDVSESREARRRLERINHLFLSMGTDFFENMEKIVGICRDMLGGCFAAYFRMEKGRLSILSTAEGIEGFTVTNRPQGYIPYWTILRDEEGPLLLKDLEGETGGMSDSLADKFGLRSLAAYPVKCMARTMGCICYYDEEPRGFSHEDLEILGMLARALTVEEERLAHEQSLKDFLDVASHELRHPITLMKGYAATISRYGDRLEEDARMEYLDVIDKAADRLDLLIRELLDGSRIERGRFVMHKLPVPLVPLLERAVREMRDKGCAHEFRIEAGEDIPPCHADAEKLVRVLVILLDNAAAHSPADFPVELSLERTNGEALITVIDRGVGVPQGDWERIFERFYQVEDALHHTTRGMGLGLFIAREIVEKHGGRIWYEPRLGGGSVFRFTIP